MTGRSWGDERPSPGPLTDARVVTYVAGAMGAVAARLVLDQGAEIVRATGRNPLKLCRDIGDVAGLGRTLGVIIENDESAVLWRGADIAVVCVRSDLSSVHRHFKIGLKYRVNLVTI